LHFRVTCSFTREKIGRFNGAGTKLQYLIRILTYHFDRQ